MKTKKIILGLMALATMMITKVNAQTNDILENKTFWITSYNEKGKEDNHEYLMFSNNKIEGSECVKYGFNAAIYTIEDNNFVATMSHKEGGDMLWNGTIDYSNKTLEGNVVWTNKKGKKTYYTFKGYQTKDTKTKDKL